MKHRLALAAASGGTNGRITNIVNRFSTHTALRLAAAALLSTATVSAAAQPAGDEDAAAPGESLQETGQEDIETVTVSAHPLSAEGISQAAVVLEGEALERDLADSIGATISRQPGLHSASFGEAVGRPVLHGLSGARVHVMEDRLGTMDASTTSGDHAIAVEPFLADRVEVLKGPSTLLYGTGAIGGVVDVHTGRIPHKARPRPSGRLELRGADNAGSKAGVRLDGGGKWAWHVDLFRREADEYDIPGHGDSAALLANPELRPGGHGHGDDEDDHGEDDHDEDDHDEDGHAEDDHDDAEDHDDEPHESIGTLIGSDRAARGGAFGLSYLGERGFGGLAASDLRYDYGLPGEEDIVLELEQQRLDLEAALERPLPGFTSLNARFGRNDYQHVEIEPGGEVGTKFANLAHEGRIELVDADAGQRVFGVQFSRREFSVLGDEAFLPPVDSNSIGAFWLGERNLERLDVETGVRIDRSRHSAAGAPGTSFTTASASLGLVVPFGRSAVLGLHSDYSTRAPTTEELYSNGPHALTRSFEVGDPELDAEVALGGAATVNWQGEAASFTATAYVIAFREHIYPFRSAEMRDGLRVSRYAQSGALFQGIDFEGRWTVAEYNGGTLALTTRFDTVAAELDTTGNDIVPQLPPSRAGVGIEADLGRYSGTLEYTRTFAVDDTAEDELSSPSYSDLRLTLDAKLPLGGSNTRLFFQGRNLTDAEQRHHASPIKDIAPLPGRTLEVGVRVSF